MIYEVIVIGGGPSGLMACNIFEHAKIKYLLLEKNETLGNKLLITGGKRCNVTNNLSTSNFITSLNLKHKKFLYHALESFGSSHIQSFFKEKGLNLVLEDNFKYFPETGKSQSILDCLLEDLNQQNIILGQNVKKIEKTDSTFTIQTKDQKYQTKNIVIATGSNSYPSTGSSGDGLNFAKTLGVTYLPFTPAETSIFSNEVIEKYKDLQGVSIENTKVKINGTKQTYTGSLLFTHFGLSGPAIFHASEDIYKALLNDKVSISFSLIEKSQKAMEKEFEIARLSNTTVIKVLEDVTTKKLAHKVLELENIYNKNVNEISKKNISSIIDRLTNFTIEINNVQTKELAFVNAGGILTNNLNPKTMEVKAQKGLYFIGETVDLHGPIGGFNITIALSTGYICGMSIVDKISIAKK